MSFVAGASSDAASGPDPDRLNQDDWKKGIGVRLSISTTPGNIDGIAKRAKNAGINLKSEPHDTEWDSRAFEVSDPSRFLLTIFSETSAVGQLWVASPVEHVTRSLRRAPGNQAPSRAAREHALRSTQRIEVFPTHGPFGGGASPRPWKGASPSPSAGV